MYKLPEMGEGGGEVIRVMPERKHSFFQEVFPKDCPISICPNIFFSSLKESKLAAKDQGRPTRTEFSRQRQWRAAQGRGEK